MNPIRSLQTFRIYPAAVLFILSPFIAFLISLRNMGKKTNGMVFVLFYTFYGYAHSFIDIRGDAYRKYLTFIHTNPDNNYQAIWMRYFQGQILDVFEPVLYLSVRKFTDDPHILLAVVGAIGGTFVYLCLQRVWHSCGTKYSYGLYLGSLLIVLFFSPVLIGGLRFFIALSIFMYGVILVLLEKRIIGWLFLILCPLIHFSFWISLAFVIISRFLRISSRILWWGLIVVCLSSVFIEAQDWGRLFASYDLSGQNEAIGGRATSYSSEKTAANFASSLTTRLMGIQQYLMRIFVLLSLFIVKKRLPSLKLSRRDEELYRLTLLFLSFGYIFISLSVVGERYLLPGLFLLIYLLCRLMTYQGEERIFRRLLIMMFIFSVLNVGWVIVNSYFLIDHRLFYAPLPLLWV